MKLRFIWLFAFAIFVISSEEKKLLSVTSGEITGKVADCVDVISGSFYLSKVDVSIIGADPVEFQSSYISQYPKGQFVGWYFFNHLQAVYQVGPQFLTIWESNGASFTYREVFRRDGEEKPKPLFEGKKHKEKRKEHNRKVKERRQRLRETELLRGSRLAGFTNTSKQKVSGENNVKNNKVVLSGDYAYLYVYLPNGVKRTYEREKPSEAKTFLEVLVQSYTYRLIEEKSPTGRKVCYRYDRKGALAEICSCNFDESKVYAWMRIHYPYNRKKVADFTVTTSDGCIANYQYNKIKGTSSYALNEIKRVDLPDEKYTYIKNKQSEIYLTSRQRVDQRSQHVNYYEIGNNHIQGKVIHISNSKDPRYKRVKSLQMPVGKNGELQTVYEFIYEVGEVGKTGGRTYVYDIDQNVSIYSYSPYLRLETVKRCGKEKGVQMERFVWGKEGTPLEANLVCHNVYDEKKNCIKSVQYTYDAFDNIIEEKAFGNFSGKNPSPIVLDQDHLPTLASSECVITRRVYSQDGKNLLLKEEKENGQKIEYQYDSVTNQVITKFIKDHDLIKIRYGYEYDKDRFLIREVCDDGESRDINDLAGVTKKEIKFINRIQQGPFIGMAQSIETRFLDLSSNQERLFQKVVFHYSNQGKVIQQDIYDADEKFVYSLFSNYDNRRRVISKTDPLGQKTEYQYDLNHNCIEETDSSGRLIKTYNRVDQVIQEKKVSKEGVEQEHYFTYNTKGQLTQITDDLANTTTFTYDGLGNQRSIQLPSLLDQHDNIQTPTFLFAYDCLGNQISKIDPNQNQTISSYTSYNQPYQIIYPDGSKKNYTYNLDGTLQSTTDPAGTTTLFQYDFLGRNISTKVISKDQELLLKTSREYSSFYPLSEIDEEGFVTSYTYNYLGEKILEEREGEKKEFVYDSLGREHKVICEDIVEIKEYDLLNRCTLEAVEDLEKTLLYKKEYEYDIQGNCSATIEYIENQPVKTTSCYDGFNRIVEEVNPFQGVTSYTYEKVQNAIGQQVLQTNMYTPLGVVHQTTYDALHQVVSKNIYDANKQEVFSFSQRYDLNGNLIWRKDQDQITYFTYDELDRMSSLIEGYQTEKEKRTEYSYTSRGLIEKIIKPDQTTLVHSYDDLARLIRKTSSDQTIDYRYQYNRLGYLISSTDQVQNHKTIREVDHKGRVLKEKLANGLTLERLYDLAGRRRQSVLFDGSSIEYEYLGKYLSSIQRNQFTHTFLAYDLAGNLLQEETINKVPIHYKRNPEGTLQEVSSSYFQQKGIEYDLEGKLCSLQWISPTEHEKTTYSYNSLNQLTSEKGRVDHTYQYDSLHNRTAKDEDVYEVNSLNQITKTKQAQYFFDPNGNLIKKISNGLETLYRYDALDRLKEVITPDSHIYYDYDSFDRRIAKTIHLQEKTVHLRFLYDGQNEIGLVNEQNTIEELRILSQTNNAERGSAIALEINQQIYIPLHDLFGDPKQLISLSGSHIESYQQDSYGVEEPSHYINPWRFSSKRVDAETNLIYFGRRYYDPQIGRWITKDPKGYADGIINLYAYVLNNPLNTMDLYGLESFWMKGLKKGLELEYGKIDVGDSLEFHLNYMEPILRKPANERKYDNFEKDIASHFNIHNFSRCEVFSRNPDSHIYNIIINGINNSYNNAISNTKYAASLSDKKLNILMVYNASHGFGKDIMEARMNQQGVITTPSRVVFDQIRRIQSEDPQNIINIISFSNGAIVASHALNLLNASEQQRINSFAFAPSRIIPPRLANISVNLASKRDFVPFLDFKNKDNLKYLERLEPHKDAKLFDHEFQSPTFRGHLRDYINMYN